MGALTFKIIGDSIVYSNVFFRRRSKKTSKLRVPGLCEGNSPVTSEFPTQRASNAENVSIWWRHHIMLSRMGSVGRGLNLLHPEFIKEKSHVLAFDIIVPDSNVSHIQHFSSCSTGVPSFQGKFVRTTFDSQNIIIYFLSETSVHICFISCSVPFGNCRYRQSYTCVLYCSYTLSRSKFHIWSWYGDNMLLTLMRRELMVALQTGRILSRCIK